MNLRSIVVLMALAGLAPVRQTLGSLPDARMLYASAPVHDSLAGGERALFTVAVPANQAAHLVITQEGIDVSLRHWEQGSAVPTYGLDFAGGPGGSEELYLPIGSSDATWNVMVLPSRRHAARGEFTISLELSIADDRARAVAAARELHYRAAEPKSLRPDQEHARDGYAAAAAAALAAGDVSQAAESTYMCARLYDNLGNTPAAIEWQKRALDLFTQIGRRDREARALDRLGDLSRKVGNVGDAEHYFEQALPMARGGHDDQDVADILNNSGLLMLSTGGYEQALEQFQTAIPLAHALDSADIEGALTHNVGVAYVDLGQYEKAIEFYRRAIDVQQALHLPRRIAHTERALAFAYFSQGDDEKARETVQSAIAHFDQSGDRLGMGEALTLFGRMQQADGHADDALALFTRARPMLHDVEDRLGEASALIAWADADIDRGEVDAALPLAAEAVRLAKIIASPNTEAGALYVQARALQRASRLDEALGSMGDAIATVEATRAGIEQSDLRTSYMARLRDYYDLYVELLQQKGRTADAFEASERGHARTLLEGLASDNAKITKGVDPTLVAQLRAAKAALEAKESYRARLALDQGDKAGLVVAAAQQIDGLRRQLSDAEDRIRTTSPAYWTLQQGHPVAVSDVQSRLLDAGTALVEYHLGRNCSYAWVVDETSITPFELPAEPALAALARRYHEVLSRDPDALAAADRAKASREIAAAGRRLAAAVWTPLAQRVRGKRLLIVADGALQYVPFAALPGSDGRPLLAAHELVYLPSASVLDALRRSSRPVQPATAMAAVFADPVFSKNDPRLGAVRDAAAPSRSRAADGGRYARLRFSRREAEAISAVSPGAFEALDFSASKGTLLSRDLRKYRILHFATHGTLDTEHPDESGLVLSLVDRNGKPVDGFLRLDEIYNLDLDADLVVLSACRTALGKDVYGEGLIGLTRGFMYAGASRVVSSVWNVDDRASALLMARFYGAMLSKKLPPARALRDAQLSLLAEPRWASPHYWAAFGLYRDDR